MFTSRKFIPLAFLLFVLCNFAGCGVTQVFDKAETPLQKAYALSATYNILLERAAETIQNTATPTSVVNDIARIESQATPIIMSMEDALVSYMTISTLLEQGKTTDDKLIIAAENLESWTVSVENIIAEFAAILSD